ncbi:MAG: FAD-dependent oxidoreductase, partial [Gemmatimonadota bacterium]|nr:FAD-dependent oxidoreductase [Gemmatimonadota bacterium]
MPPLTMMHRDADALKEAEFDLLVIGAGILGAFIAWDAALRGLSVAVVDRGDFGGATSANSMGILHGGLRYLQQANLARARRSLSDRAAWIRTAPHLVRPLPVLVPCSSRVLSTAFRAAVRLT